LENSNKIIPGDDVVTYKLPSTNPKETFVGDKYENMYETMDPILDNNNRTTYTKWEYPKDCTPSRKKALKEYFVKWANDIGDNGFAGNIQFLEDKTLYINNNLNAGLNIKELAGNEKIQTQTAIRARKLQGFLRDLFFSIDTMKQKPFRIHHTCKCMK
jgi:hypothetical protein